MGETEQAVGDEIEVEELAGKELALLEDEENNKSGELEADFHGDRGPGKTTEVVALTAACVEAAEPTPSERNGNEYRKTISGNGGVANDTFYDLNTDPAAGKRTGDRFS